MCVFGNNREIIFRVEKRLKIKINYLMNKGILCQNGGICLVHLLLMMFTIVTKQIIYIPFFVQR